jgi:hypothetical protein
MSVFYITQAVIVRIIQNTCLAPSALTPEYPFDKVH